MRVVAIALTLLITTVACAQQQTPANLTSTARIADEKEPGERMVITGTILASDGRTPAANVVLYAYHTNAQGIYPKRGNETGDAQQHGYLRGWLRTDKRGAYRIESIRPGGYPGRPDPAHVHLVVKVEGKPEFWIDEFVFDDDPRVDAYRGRPGFAVVTLAKKNGVWTGTKDIVLP